MCECVCQYVNWTRKITDSEGNAVLLGVYMSCNDCDAPAGVRMFRCPPEDWTTYDAEFIPEVEFRNRCAFIDVVGIHAVREAMENAIKGYAPESGVIDYADAEVLAEEAFNSLRGVCALTQLRGC